MPTTRHETYPPEGLADRVEKYCAENDLAISQFYRRAAEEYIDSHE